jgi:hypothetical protein
MFEIKVSYLRGTCSTTWATPLALFSFSYFSDMVFWVFTQGGPQTFIFLHMPHHTDGIILGVVGLGHR